MINIDQQLEDALNHRLKYGDAKGRQATADDALKATYAMIYLDVPDHLKTVPEKDAWIKRTDEYRQAIEEKKERYAEWEAARLKMQILFAAVEKYRTDKSSERTMMRASQ